jgi:cysteine synthase
MPLSYAELEQFYEGLVARARRRGIVCGITSGMACVAYGVTQATQDCDLLDPLE